MQKVHTDDRRAGPAANLPQIGEQRLEQRSPQVIQSSRATRSRFPADGALAILTWR